MPRPSALESRAEAGQTIALPAGASAAQAPAQPAGRGGRGSRGGLGGPGADDPANATADYSEKSPVLPLSPEEQVKRFWLPPGYRMEPVLSDPHIEIQFDSPGQGGRGGGAGRGGAGRGGVAQAPGSSAAAAAGAPPAGPQPVLPGAPPSGFPRGYRVEVSADGKTWSAPVAEGVATPSTVIAFAPVRAKFVRITQTAAAEGAPPWSIQRLRLFEVRDGK